MSRKAAQQLAAARVRASGGRVTAARVQVLAALLSRGGALRHHELEDVLGPRPLDRVTLYRVLDWLVARGLAHRISGTGRARRFSAADRGHDAHAHFQCDRCGKLVCLERVRTRRRPPAVPRGFRAEGVEVTVKGVCARCA
jgi:Fur family ferric uptake transcriptional regulator